MAAFVAKQMLGNQLSSAKGAMPGGGDDSKKEKTEEELSLARLVMEFLRERLVDLDQGLILDR